MIIRSARGVALILLVLGIWTLVMIAMPFVGGRGRQVAVIGDSAAAVRTIAAAGGTVVEVRRGATLARSDHPGFVAGLYVEGAPLVVEGRIAAGCFAKAGE